MDNRFNDIKQIIESRRTIKPDMFNGKIIPDEQIIALLQLADWAPTHGRTEPWHFNVYGGEAVKNFCFQHAEMYKSNVATESFMQGNYNKLLNMGNAASHIIIAAMKRGNLPKIPALEEVAAASCAIQNILLGATALGIASYWGSGGMAYHPPMKEFLSLGEQDQVLGILYFGYSAQNPSAIRNRPLSDKMVWNK